MSFSDFVAPDLKCRPHRPLLSSSTHALRRLFSYARQYRRDTIIASIYSALNKFFDVLPEVLIGVAVDVVVNRRASFLGRFGITDTMQQLTLIGALTPRRCNTTCDLTPAAMCRIGQEHDGQAAAAFRCAGQRRDPARRPRLQPALQPLTQDVL